MRMFCAEYDARYAVYIVIYTNISLQYCYRKVTAGDDDLRNHKERDRTDSLKRL